MCGVVYDFKYKKHKIIADVWEQPCQQIAYTATPE